MARTDSTPHRTIRFPFAGLRVPPPLGALALGSAIVGLAALSGERPTRPWTEPPTSVRTVRPPVRPVAYRPQPVTIQPPELLALAGRTAPQSTFRVQLTSVLQDGALKVSSASGLLVVDAVTHKLIAQAPGNMEYTVSLSPDGRALSGPTGKDLPSARVRIQPISPDTPMLTGARSYLGALEVTLGARGLDVINEVAQEDYIAGVVAGEAARSFPLEALKAQAVAARTYAMSQRGHRGPDIDVVDTVADQVYTGAGVAWPEVREAVNATAGQVLTYGGQPIVAYFSADCGGSTRSNIAGGLGSRPLPYLKAVRDADENGRDYCAASPSHTWSRTLTEQDILPKLNAKLGLALETLKEVRFTQVYSDGRVGEVSVMGLGAPLKPTDGPVVTKPSPGARPVESVIRPASFTRDAALGDPVSEAQPSRPVEGPTRDEGAPEGTGDVTPETPADARSAPVEPPAADAAAPKAPPPASPRPPATQRTPTAPKTQAEPATPEPTPSPSVDTPTDTPTAPEDGTEPVIPEIRRLLRAFDFRRIVGTNVLRSQIMSVSAAGEGAWTFSGRGYGHGVGMCQWGACGLARNGAAYDRILSHYYTGVTLEQTAARNGVLEGIAKDRDGRPAANATVSLVGVDREVRTDAQGQFRFEALPAATYNIVVTPTDDPAAMSFAWLVRPNETTSAVVRLA